MANLIQQTNDLIMGLMILIPNIIGLCSMIAALFPKPRKAGLAKKLHKWVNVAACNVKHAENKT